MRSLTSLLIVAGLVAMAGCATTRGYKICNDLDANVTCPDNTANVVIGM